MGPKKWVNSFTEVENLGGNRYGATIHVGHQVFKDKVDGQWKRHKLTDERPEKDYVLIQSAKCCIEVYPYYTVYYDVNHEEVRVYNSRWVVEEWDGQKWKDLGFWNPTIIVESKPNGIKVIREGQTTNGILKVEFIQLDGSLLKHRVTWTNVSVQEKTVRLVLKWAGIVGDKIICSGKEYSPPLTISDYYFIFGDEQNPKKVGQLLLNQFKEGNLNPVTIETHAKGMKADFQFEEFIVLPDNTVVIDPATWTNSDPTEDGYIENLSGTISRYDDLANMIFGFNVIKAGDRYRRAYVEWNIDGIPDNATITLVKFQYHGGANLLSVDTSYIYSMENQPSTASDSTVYSDCADGTAYVSGSTTFPVVGTGQEIDLGSNAVSDLESVLDVRSWWAIGMVTDEVTSPELASIYTEEEATADPKPTLYVEYIPVYRLTQNLSVIRARARRPVTLLDAKRKIESERDGMLATLAELEIIAEKKKRKAKFKL